MPNQPPSLSAGQARYYDRCAWHSLQNLLAGRRKRGSCSAGQATLSFILLVSGVVLEVAIAGSFVAYFMNAAGFGERLAARALAAARAGVDDAMLQVVRNKELVTAGTSAYAFSMGGDTASVLISRTSDSGAGTYIYSVASTGVAGSRERKLVARIVVNQTNGLAELQSVAEQSVD
jgi:hypothetical protein